MCVTVNQDVCSGNAFLHPLPPPFNIPNKHETKPQGKDKGVSRGILWLCYSLKTKEKGRGVCGIQKSVDERLRNVTTQKINKSSNKKLK